MTDDKQDRWTAAIDAAFPTRSGSHEQYAIAMQMVGNRHSKGALVALVNWLLVEQEKHLDRIDEVEREAAQFEKQGDDLADRVEAMQKYKEQVDAYRSAIDSFECEVGNIG